ncbi:hypothetical protein SAMN05660826_01423 [Caldanaerovirga acetigignens]|uniref:Uncharacterized protein n=1 Tax=Caldanaerovirga acetigignens TaxID=447595 RepID=A0A1M7K0R8_9FIRM|nr:hypothetical protein [Caldanaerovirga acetigignens]SHM58771.1 hypothetical protein SAMN05660826_01423 [Caldanaerovirga acetigignens]
MEDKVIEQAIERFIEIDGKAANIKETREKNLAELESKYRREIQDMIENFNQKIDEKVNEIYSKALSEGNREVEELKKRARELIKTMETKYLEIKEEIINKFLSEIFDIKRF